MSAATNQAIGLSEFLAAEVAVSQRSEIRAMADAVRERFGDAAQAVLFYGSCLRTGEVVAQVLDFYVIVSSYKKAYSSGLMAVANKLLPPNVFYLEKEIDGVRLRAKFAVISLEDFRRRCGEQALNVSIWARFCQPVALVWVSGVEVGLEIARGLADAVRTAVRSVLPFLDYGALVDGIWPRVFELTYGAELRSEPVGKGAELVSIYRQRYERITPIILADFGIPVETDGEGRLRIGQSFEREAPRKAARRWMWRRLNGKFVSLLRLVKGAFTFDGGLDYLAWKIARHSGVEIKVKPWQRRFPLVAGIVLFLSLRLKGAFR